MSNNEEDLAASSSSSSNSIKVRCLVQQCKNAKLYVKLADEANNIQPEYVQIDRGAVLFVCFMKDAKEADVEKLAKSVVNVRLSELDSEANKYTSILDLPGSILIIPQATLGGRMKGKMIQYHYNVNKDVGFELYEKFISFIKKFANENEKWAKSGTCKVENGTYGIRQVYSTETNGPYLHLIEF